MSAKIFFNFGRRKVVYYSVILVSFLLVQWQFHSGNQIKLANQTESIQPIATSNPLPPALEYLNGGDSSSFSISNETCILANNMSSTPLPPVDVSTSIQIEPQAELYQVIETFSAEDKVLGMNTTFKRILFWNEV
jgi:hypothetical protein